MSSQSTALGCRLQEIAAALNELLTEIAGDPVTFILVIEEEGATNYISNAERADGRALLEGLIARWDATHADIPAHYNPDQKDTPWKH